MTTITDDTPIVMLTIGQLKEVLREILSSATTPLTNNEQTERYNSDEYVFGLRGICDLFGVFLVTAQKYKNTWLAPAVKQRGHKIIVNRKMALELFNAWKSQGNQ